MSTQNTLHADLGQNCWLWMLRCDQYNNQRFRGRNKRHNRGFPTYDPHLINLSNQMDKTLEPENWSFSRIALGLYQRSTFLRNCHYGTGNAFPTNTPGSFQLYCSPTSSRLPTYLIQSRTILLFIHSFQHNFSAPTLYQIGPSASECLKSKHLPKSHRPATTLECNCKGHSQKKKKLLPYTLKMIFPINQ